jgi:UDP-N-acetylmuramate dehydrogenase
LKLSKKPKVNSTYGDIQKILDEKNISVPTIKDISDAVIEIRQSKLPDPKELGNAGSFFKNPEVEKSIAEKIQQDFPNMPKYDLPNGKIKIPAAWLIEQCGWKGKQIGQTGNHAKQALVIVNYGNASGNEIWQHALNVQKSVQSTFGILLEPEVNIIT